MGVSNFAESNFWTRSILRRTSLWGSAIEAGGRVQGASLRFVRGYLIRSEWRVVDCRVGEHRILPSSSLAIRALDYSYLRTCCKVGTATVRLVGTILCLYLQYVLHCMVSHAPMHSMCSMNMLHACVLTWHGQPAWTCTCMWHDMDCTCMCADWHGRPAHGHVHACVYQCPRLMIYDIQWPQACTCIGGWPST